MLSQVGFGKYSPKCDVYFERTSNFKVHPSIVKRSGLLSKKWRTKSITCLSQTLEGLYIAEDLHSTPHCMELNSRRRFIQSLARTEKDLEVDILSPNGVDVVTANGITALGLKNEVYRRVLRKEVVDALHLTDLQDQLLQQMKEKVSERGNIALGSGFAAQKMQQHSSGVFAPSIINSTTLESVKRMCVLSDIIREVSDGLGIECPFTNDHERTQTFANSLCGNFNLPLKNANGHCANVIEHMTCALTTVDTETPILFGCHVDSLNCRQKGWNKVFVMYYHFEHMNKLYRLCMIAYSRAAINSYFVRNRRCAGNRSAQRLKCLLPTMKEGQTFAYIHRLPLFDKNKGFLSLFASILRKCILCQSHSQLERASELVLPMMWLTTSVLMYTVLNQWISHKQFPQGIWTNAVVSEIVNKYGGFTSGTGQRYQPSLNFSLLESEIVDGLRTVYSVIQELNGTENTVSTTDLHDMYDKTINKLKTVVGVGDIGAQHGLSILVLSGVIHHPRLATMMAKVAKGTKTFSKLKKHFSIGEATSNRLYQELAEELGVTVSVIENIVCEYFRDVKDPETEVSEEVLEESIRTRGIFRPDTFFNNQDMIFINDLGERYAFGCNKDDIQILPNICIQTQVSSDVKWQIRSFSPFPDIVVKVSANSRHRTEIRLSINTKKVIKPTKIHHTGVGLIEGHEQSVFVKYEKRRQKAGATTSDDEEEYSPEMGFRSNLSRQQELVLALSTFHRVTRKTKAIDVLSIFSATREEGTYVFLDVKTTCCKILDGESSQPPRTKKRKTKSHFQTSCEYLEAIGKYGYTAEIRCSTHVILSSRQDKSILSSHNFLGFKNGRAYYQTKKAALECVYITTLVLFAMQLKKSDNKIDPLWTTTKLPDARQNEPTRDFCVLYQNAGTASGDELFGLLFFRGDRRVLSIPSDKDDLSAVWEDYCFADYCP